MTAERKNNFPPGTTRRVVGKDYQSYLAVTGEALKQHALEHKAKNAKDSWNQGVVVGWTQALDILWDYIAVFGLAPEDLNWHDFVPERDLLAARGEKLTRTRRPKP